MELTIVISVLLLLGLSINSGWCEESRDLFVSHSGHDSKGCGVKRKNPCHTLLYAINKSDWYFVIHLEGSADHYTVETPGGRYINLTHSLTLTTVGQGRATIACNKSQVALFNVYKSYGDNDKRNVTLSLKTVQIRNCHGSWQDDSVIQITNAAVNVKDCNFVNNGVLFDHSSLTENCSYVKLDVARSDFTENGVVKYFMPAINILTCRQTLVTIMNSQFNWTPMKFSARTDMTLMITGVSVDGKGLRSSSLDITLSLGRNAISITNSTIQGHSYSSGSPVTISVNQEMAPESSVTLNAVVFCRNTFTKSTGAALSLMTRLSVNRNLSISTTLNECSFEHNSALKARGGAVYLEGVAGVRFNRCQFLNNSAENGGAVYGINGHNIVMVNTTFINNVAVGEAKTNSQGQGGALSVINTDLSLMGCHFTNNKAGFRGQAVHLTESLQVQLAGNLFENSQNNGEDYVTELYLQQAHGKDGKHPQTSFTQNTFSVNHDAAINSAYHLETFWNIEYLDNILCCPGGQQPSHFSHTSIEINDESKYVRYAMCNACPIGTYNLHVKCSNFSKSIEPGAECNPCPHYARCDGGGKITPITNYWAQKDAASITFHMCPKFYCDKTNCDDVACCSQNRSGKLCGRCEEDHFFDLASQKCIEEGDCKYHNTFLLIYSGLFSLIYAVIVTIFSLISRRKEHFTTSCLTVQESAGSPDTLQTDADPDTSSESFEPSIEYNNSVDSHSLVPVHEGTQTSQGLSDSSTVTDRLYTNLVSHTPFVLCVWISLIQLVENVYMPWTGRSDTQNRILNGMMDAINLRPLFVFLERPCGDGYLASVLEPALGLMCIAGMFAVFVLGFLVDNVILTVIEKIKAVDLGTKRSCHNAFVYHALMSVLVVTHVPLLKHSFSLINCVDHVNTSHAVMFLNAEVSCHQWWHYIVIATITVIQAPLGVALWMGIQLLKSNNIRCGQFMAGLLVPLLSVLYWECRYGKRICRCLLRYEYIYARMQLESINLDRQFYHTEVAIVDFFNIPFIRDSKVKNKKSGSNAWIIFLFLRSFIVVTFAVLLGSNPIVKNIVLFCCFLCAMALHFCFQPYSINLANRVEIGILGVLTFLSVLGLYNTVLYTLGMQPYGYFLNVVRVFDWIYVVLVGLVLLELFIVVFVHAIKACASKCRR